eukprot:1958747-Rhodomonas_salina.1
MSSFIGAPPTDEDWDIPRKQTTELYDSLSFWRDHLLCLSLRPHPIRQLTGHQLHAFWLLPDENRPLPPPSLGFASLFDVAA